MPSTARSLLDDRAMTLDAYASALADSGSRVCPGGYSTFWIRYETVGIMRIPTFCTTPPSPGEVDTALRQSRALAAAYVRPPDEEHAANAWLYVCRNKAYRLDELSTAGRRDARRAQRSFSFQFLDWPTVLAMGHQAFADTRRRVGLSDGTSEQFTHRMRRFASHPAHTAVGALKDGFLTAFMTLAVVDDWVEIEGCFSANQHRSLCPNDGLAHFVLRHHLAEGPARTVSYGLSSIQDGHQADGLHAYKQKVGFEAIPVHRAFVLHPFMRPLANEATWQGMRLIERLFPRTRLVKKATGMLASVLAKDRYLTTCIDENLHG